MSSSFDAAAGAERHAPEFLFTQHDVDEGPPIDRSVKGLDRPSLSRQGTNASRIVRHDAALELDKLAPKRNSLTPLSTTEAVVAATEPFDAVGLGPPKRRKSFAPELVRASSTLGRVFNRATNFDQNASSSPGRCRLDFKPHVPYEAKSNVQETPNLDVIIVYMFVGNASDAHETFFECPAPALDLLGRAEISPPVPTQTSNGDARAPEHTDPALKMPDRKNTNLDTPEKKVTNWLTHRNMLPKILPFSRIICIGFDVSSAPKDQRISFESASEDLHRFLLQARKHCPTRPAIMVGHGYGCRVVQCTIMRTHNATSTDPLQGKCAGVMFYHAPPEDSDPKASELVVVADKCETDPITTPNAPSTKSGSTGAHQKLEKAMREQSILHHFLHHGPVGKTASQSMRFSNTNDRAFQSMSAKFVEWSETHQLLHAVQKAEYSKVASLIQSGIDINQRKSATSATALHVACQAPSSRSHDIRLLLQQGNADVAAKDVFGRTALHYAVERTPPDTEIVRALLESGAQTKVLDVKGSTPLDLTRSNKERRQIRELLRKRPLVVGPSATKSVLATSQPHSPLAKQVCDSYQMAATEMYLNRETWTEKHVPRHFSIHEAIYGKSSLQKLLDETRTDNIHEDLICQWFHLPANNMTWVEDLFRNRFKVDPNVWSEQVRDSEWPHGRCIIPHASRFAADAGGEKVEILAMCLPYLSYEENERQTSVSDTVEEQITKDTTEHVLPTNIYRLWKMEKVRNGRYFDTSSTLPLPSMSRQHAFADAQSPTSWSRRGSLPNTEGSGSDGQGSVRSATRTSSPAESTSNSEEDSSDDESRPRTSSKLSRAEKLLVQAYLQHHPPLHIRRTLDQYYYYMLKDTRERDQDQVVTRWAKDELGKRRHNILMVDQLWLWVIKGNGDFPDRVISSFPDRQGLESGSLDDLQRNVLNQNPRDRKPIATTADLCSRIVATCSDIFSWSQEAELVRFLHFFEATVGRVGDDEIRLLKKFKERSEYLQDLKDSHVHYHEQRDKVLIEMLDIRQQIDLLEEAKDIRDEINIILHVLGEQWRVLQTDTVKSPIVSHEQHEKKGPPIGHNSAEPWAEPLRIIKRATGDFDKMNQQVKEIHDDLNHLLDLQQKQATVWEARSTREGARATTRQSFVMVVFTTVTIIFLPLSFMASFFALDIDEYPSDDKGQTSWPLRRVCAFLFGISFAVIIPFIALAFATDFVFGIYHKVEKAHIIPLAIGFLRLLPSWMMKKRCTKAIDWIERHRDNSYGPTPSVTDTPKISRSHRGLAKAVSVDSMPVEELSDASSDSKQTQLNTKVTRWLKQRRRRRGQASDERV